MKGQTSHVAVGTPAPCSVTMDVLEMHALTQIPGSETRRGLEPDGANDILRRPHVKGRTRSGPTGFDFDLPLSEKRATHHRQFNSDGVFTRSNIVGLCPKLETIFTRFMLRSLAQVRGQRAPGSEAVAACMFPRMHVPAYARARARTHTRARERPLLAGGVARRCAPGC